MSLSFARFGSNLSQSKQIYIHWPINQSTFYNICCFRGIGRKSWIEWAKFELELQKPHIIWSRSSFFDFTGAANYGVHIGICAMYHYLKVCISAVYK